MYACRIYTFTSICLYFCMAVWLYDCMAVRLYSLMSLCPCLYVYDCMSVCVYGGTQHVFTCVCLLQRVQLQLSEVHSFDCCYHDVVYMYLLPYLLFNPAVPVCVPSCNLPSPCSPSPLSLSPSLLCPSFQQIFFH